MVLLVAVGGGVAWWTKSDGSTTTPAFRAQNVYEVAYKFPEGTELGADELTVGPNEVLEAEAQSPSNVSQVMPAQCNGLVKMDTSRLLGSTSNTVTGSLKGVQYTVNAQVIPVDRGARKVRPSVCDQMTIEYSDGGYTLVSPAETPKIEGVTVEGRRSVLRTAQQETVDSFNFIAWIDDHRAIIVQASSDPTYKPQANPIDPTLAKELLVEAVRLTTNG